MAIKRGMEQNVLSVTNGASEFREYKKNDIKSNVMNINYLKHKHKNYLLKLL